MPNGKSGLDVKDVKSSNDVKDVKSVIGNPSLWESGQETVIIATKDEKGQWVNTNKTVPIPKMSHPFVGYRGDDRAPQLIFELGFQPKKVEKAVFRAAKVSSSDNRLKKYEFEGAGDVAPANIVCVSSSLEAAALFPLPAKQPLLLQPPDLESYIYVIHVEEAWNTSYLQTLRALQSWENIKKDEKLTDDLRAAVGATLYGREHFCKNIEGSSILCAVKCVRKFTSWSYHNGGTFVLSEVIENRACKNPLKALVVKALNDELKYKVGPRPLPIPGMGFHRSDPRALSPNEQARPNIVQPSAAQSSASAAVQAAPLTVTIKSKIDGKDG